MWISGQSLGLRRLHLVISLVIGGCALSGEEFHKAGVSADQKAQDVTYCDAYAMGHRQSPSYGGLAGVAGLTERYNGLFTTCMMDRGYRYQPSN